MPKCGRGVFSFLPGKRELVVERLEVRAVPDGNLAAFVSDSRLTILGDEFDNRIQIVADADDGVLVCPLDATTTVNGQTQPVGFSDIKFLDVHLRDGNDQLLLNGLKLKDVHVDLGAGDDNATIDGVYAKHSMNVLGNSGIDSISILGTTVRRQLMVHAGDGNDKVNIDASHFGKDGQLDGGAGTDTLINGNYSYDRNFGIFDFENPPADAFPVANSDEATVAEGESVDIAVANNDVAQGSALDLESIRITAPPANGSLVVNLDGSVTYTHNGSESTTDVFRYRIANVDGFESNEVSVTITVLQVNDDPVAVNDDVEVVEGATANFSIVANDTDPEGRLDVASIAIVGGPSFGSVTANVDGTVTYVHDGSEATFDSFDYTISDADGGLSNIATVQIAILGVNDPPTANDDVDTVRVEDSVTIDVAANDFDLDDVIDLNSIVIESMPTNGDVVVNGDGTVTYSHDGNFIFSDLFTYSIADASGARSNLATVTIFVNFPPA